MTTEIDRYRDAARALRRAFRTGDAAARDRVRAHAPGRAEPRHADFLHTIAREAGHESWPRLKLALEARAMDRAARARRLGEALFEGRDWVVRDLLALDPDLAAHDLGIRVALYDRAAVADAVAADPEAATRPIGARTPLLHLAFSRHHRVAPEKRADMLAIADLLLAAGADPNEGFPAEPGGSHRLSALYGALGHADNMPLAEKLLAAGATPDDDESLYHATELGHHEGLRLLIRHGVETRNTNALLRAIDFDDAEAVRMLLEHGADPNEARFDHPSGQPMETIPALHQCARRHAGAAVARLLLAHGADPAALWEGRSAYAVARVYGNAAVAEALAAEGHATTLTPDEEILAACAAGRAPGARLDPAALTPEDRKLLTRLALMPGRLAHAQALVAAGLDPHAREEMDMPPLHVALWHGRADTAAWLLSLGADLAHVNAYGGDALGTLMHGAEHAPPAPGQDHVACAEALLAAGAPLTPRRVAECGDEALAGFLEDRLAER